MAAIFPPDDIHGKQLKTWYRQKMQVLTGDFTLPDGWENRIGLEVKTTIVLVAPKAYEKWDMRYELLSYATWRTYY